jgi:hypothetical protein
MNCSRREQNAQPKSRLPVFTNTINLAAGGETYTSGRELGNPDVAEPVRRDRFRMLGIFFASTRFSCIADGTLLRLMRC